MAKKGTKIYCPNCNTFQICRALSPTTMIGRVKNPYRQYADHQDIAWFRRARECLNCQRLFLSAEVAEILIDELVELRKRLAERQIKTAAKLRRQASWLKREDNVPLDVAERFVHASAWWLTHFSGNPVRAPNHAGRLYKSHLGWAVEFGANTFLVGKAIDRCAKTLNSFIDKSSEGRILLLPSVKHDLMRSVSGAVATREGNEYSGYYPIVDGNLVFGAQAINVEDAAEFMISESGIAELV